MVARVTPSSMDSSVTAPKVGGHVCSFIDRFVLKTLKVLGFKVDVIHPIKCLILSNSL